LGAKKLDVNFDADDFFNQFDPSAVKKEAKKPVIVETKKSETPSEIKFGGNTPVVEEKPKSNLEEYNSQKQKYNQKLSATDNDDVQQRYEALIKSGATAIGSEMLFGEEEKAKDTGSAGRWSTPASLQGLGERLSDQLAARSSFGSAGSGSISDTIKSAKKMAKGYAPEAYEKAS